LALKSVPINDNGFCNVSLMDPTQKDQLSDLTNFVQVATPLHHYVNAFNARDQLAMASVFSEDLLTIHPS